MAPHRRGHITTTWKVFVDGQRVDTQHRLANDRDTLSKRFQFHHGTQRIVVTKSNPHVRTY